MATLAQRLIRNVPGRFYVDDQCIDCDLCRALAPEFFTRDDETSFSFVHRQPVTPAEIALVEEAVSDCPAEAIGNDGSS